MKEFTLTKWSAIAEILSSIAVLITLVYLAIQTKQNSEMLQAQVEADYIQTRHSVEADLFRDGVKGAMLSLSKGEVPSESDAYDLMVLSRRILTGWEWEYLQYRRGYYPSIRFEGWKDMASIIPTLQRVMNETPRQYDAEFVRFLKANVFIGNGSTDQSQRLKRIHGVNGEGS